MPGDLLGPFDGQVLDAGSGKPVEGAAVLGSWAFEDGGGLTGPSSAAWQLTETDADGRYAIGRLSTIAGGRIARFTVVVYKRGFAGWRSDRRFEDFSARHDFAQRGNIARMARMPAEGSHIRLVRFVGAGGPLLAKLGWELQQASLEAEAARGRGESEGGVAPAPATAGGVLDANQLLSADELKAVTGYGGDLTVEKLGDLPTTAQYDSAHFHAEGQPEKFDAALRLFRLPKADAEKQYEVLVRELPGAEEKNEVGDRSLRAREGEVFAVGALDRAHGVVVLFTCGVAQCSDHDTAVKLVRRMWTRLGRLSRAPAEGPAAPAGLTPPAEKEAP
ncbi:MAG: carboxypeptidase regulatory-like domain-containing protein [Myxococcales bacterium]|nr:carboxypeptidase regulatory-like domain-containing protein [Myxococcales bacterium]